VRDATGESDRVPAGGRAMEVLDVSGGERSSEIGMQHFEPRFLCDDASPHAEQVPARSIVSGGRLGRIGRPIRTRTCLSWF
jgi:hypothetical protein